MKFVLRNCSIVTLLLLNTLASLVYSQTYMVDKIVGVVGKNQILYSDIEDQYLQLQAQGVKPMPTKCEVFEELLSQKLMVNQAAIDSIEISDAEIESELDQRVNYFIGQIGSEDKLVAYFGKSILEIKEDMRDLIRDQLLMQRMRGEIITGTEVTPGEVKSFYNQLPPDSIPFIDAEVEINQILLYPTSNEKSVFEVKEKLLAIRERITNGESFATMAVLYSDDPSSRKGGDIGWASKNELDPAYSKAAYALKKGQVSKIVESAFGFHIIQLIERTDDRIHTRHILMKPKVSPEEKEKTNRKLDSIAQLIRLDTLSFEQAATFFSQDESTKMNGGLRVNYSTGNTKFQLNEFETSEYYIIRNLKIGEMSEAYESIDEKGKVVFKIVRLKSKTEPHKANIKQDYELLRNMSMHTKQEEIVDNWIKDKIKNTYIRINEPYETCTFRIKEWTGH